MKHFIVMVVALAALVAADEHWSAVTEKEALHKIQNDCVKESGASAEQVEKLRNLEHPDEKEAREYIRCFVKELGVFNDDKGYNLERLVSQIGVVFADHEKLREILTGCVDSNEQKSTPDEWAYRGHKCTMESTIGDTFKATKKIAS